MDDPADIEELAAVEHSSWSSWTDYMLDRQREELAKALSLAGGRPGLIAEFDMLPSTKRWRRQAATLYVDLPEDERESDRIEARKKLKAYRP